MVTRTSIGEVRAATASDDRARVSVRREEYKDSFA